MITLVLGGARSGKSALAERLVLAHPGPLLYLATGRADGDADMAERIDRHRRDRDPRFTTVETDDLAAAARRRSPAADAGRRARHLGAPAIPTSVDDAARSTSCAGPSSTGRPGGAARPWSCPTRSASGVHPESAVGRRFRDVLGTVNQRVAAVADDAVLVVAGRVLRLDRRRARSEGAAMRGAVAFLTPFGGARRPSRRAFDWFPVVGAVIGLALGGIWWGADRLWPPARHRRPGRRRRPRPHRAAARRRPGRLRRRADRPDGPGPPARGDGRPDDRRVRRGHGRHRAGAAGRRAHAPSRRPRCCWPSVWCASADGDGGHRPHAALRPDRTAWPSAFLGGAPAAGRAVRHAARLGAGHRRRRAPRAAGRSRCWPSAPAWRPAGWSPPSPSAASAASPATCSAPPGCSARRSPCSCWPPAGDGGAASARPRRAPSPLGRGPRRAARRPLRRAADRAAPGGRRSGRPCRPTSGAATTAPAPAASSTPRSASASASGPAPPSVEGSAPRPRPRSSPSPGGAWATPPRWWATRSPPATSTAARHRGAVAGRARPVGPRRGRHRARRRRVGGREHRRRGRGPGLLGRAGRRARRARATGPSTRSTPWSATAPPATPTTAGPAPGSTTWPTGCRPGSRPRWSSAVRPASAASVLRAVRHDAPDHPSPNSGVAEAAFAAALGLRLGGESRYGDRVELRPTLGDGRPARARRHRPSRGPVGRRGPGPGRPAGRDRHRPRPPAAGPGGPGDARPDGDLAAAGGRARRRRAGGGRRPRPRPGRPARPLAEPQPVRRRPGARSWPATSTPSAATPTRARPPTPWPRPWTSTPIGCC